MENTVLLYTHQKKRRKNTKENHSIHSIYKCSMNQDEIKRKDTVSPLGK